LIRFYSIISSKVAEFRSLYLVRWLIFLVDSTVELSQWRVLLNMLSTEERKGIAVPRFDDTRHAGLCSEVSAI
jgi:hypothetical protein